MTLRRNQGFIDISEKRGLHVGQVYNIVKTHDINVLNVNIIKLMELNNEAFRPTTKNFWYENYLESN